MKDRETEIVIGSGNVFADLGLENAEELMARAQLALAIRRQIEARGLTQAAAAKLLGTDHAKVSHLLRGKLEGFTSDRLFRYLNRLGCNVHIQVEATHEDAEGRTLVTTG